METRRMKKKRDKEERDSESEHSGEDEEEMENLDPKMFEKLGFAISKKDFSEAIKEVLESQNRSDYNFSPDAEEAIQIGTEIHVRDVIRCADTVAALNGRDELAVEDIRVVRKHFMDHDDENGKRKKKKMN